MEKTWLSPPWWGSENVTSQEDLGWQKSVLQKVQHQSWVVKRRKQVNQSDSPHCRTAAPGRSQGWDLTFVLKPQRMLYTASKLLTLGNANDYFWARGSQRYWVIKIKLMFYSNAIPGGRSVQRNAKQI